MGGGQNHGPFLGTLNNRCRIIIGTQKGTIILTITQMFLRVYTAGMLRWELLKTCCALARGTHMTLQNSHVSLLCEDFGDTPTVHV